MRTQQWLALGSLLGALGLILAATGPAHSQRPQQGAQGKQSPAEEDLPSRIIKSTKLPEADVVKVLNAIGPAIREELARGKTVGIPGLGNFRIVQIQAHRDMVNGRPVTVQATNTIEFLASGEAAAAANTGAAKPADSVPPFQYITLPGQTPGQKAPSTRTPSTRTR